jgi:hypothetical protein
MNNDTEILTKLIALLENVEEEKRNRLIKSAMVFLGSELISTHQENSNNTDEADNSSIVFPKVNNWLKRHGIEFESLSNIFHIDNESTTLIASIPGNSNKEKTLNAYILKGLEEFFSTGEPKFQDEDARDLCKSSGCYDSTNHSTFLKGKKNIFIGDKAEGWTLTTPGLDKSAELVNLILTNA